MEKRLKVLEHIKQKLNKLKKNEFLNKRMVIFSSAIVVIITAVITVTAVALGGGKDDESTAHEIITTTAETETDTNGQLEIDYTEKTTQVSKEPSTSIETVANNTIATDEKSSASTTEKTIEVSATDSNAGKKWYEAEYKYVKHPEETQEIWVVDKDAYTYEEPIYETVDRAICDSCNEDITGKTASHVEEHRLNDTGNKGWHSEVKKIQNGTRTIYVEEKGHWETKVVIESWIEKILVREEGWY